MDGEYTGLCRPSLASVDSYLEVLGASSTSTLICLLVLNTWVTWRSTVANTSDTRPWLQKAIPVFLGILVVNALSRWMDLAVRVSCNDILEAIFGGIGTLTESLVLAPSLGVVHVLILSKITDATGLSGFARIGHWMLRVLLVIAVAGSLVMGAWRTALISPMVTESLWTRMAFGIFQLYLILTTFVVSFLTLATVRASMKKLTLSSIQTDTESIEYKQLVKSFSLTVSISALTVMYMLSFLFGNIFAGAFSMLPQVIALFVVKLTISLVIKGSRLPTATAFSEKGGRRPALSINTSLKAAPAAVKPAFGAPLPAAITNTATIEKPALATIPRGRYSMNLSGSPGFNILTVGSPVPAANVSALSIALQGPSGRSSPSTGVPGRSSPSGRASPSGGRASSADRPSPPGRSSSESLSESPSQTRRMSLIAQSVTFGNGSGGEGDPNPFNRMSASKAAIAARRRSAVEPRSKIAAQVKLDISTSRSPSPTTDSPPSARPERLTSYLSSQPPDF